MPLPDQLLASAARPSFPIDLPALLRNVEDLYIAAALDTARGNRKAAADSLGLQRTTLVEKLRRRQKDALPVTPARALAELDSLKEVSNLTVAATSPSTRGAASAHSAERAGCAPTAAQTLATPHGECARPLQSPPNEHPWPPPS